MFDVCLDLGIVESPSDQALGVEHRVGRIHGHLIFGRVAQKTLGFREGDIAGRRTVTLVVGDDFHFSLLPYSDTGVRRS